jgi:hypothetical protein
MNSDNPPLEVITIRIALCPASEAAFDAAKLRLAEQKKLAPKRHFRFSRARELGAERLRAAPISNQQVRNIVQIVASGVFLGSLPDRPSPD